MLGDSSGILLGNQARENVAARCSALGLFLCFEKMQDLDRLSISLGGRDMREMHSSNREADRRDHNLETRKQDRGVKQRPNLQFLILNPRLDQVFRNRRGRLVFGVVVLHVDSIRSAEQGCQGSGAEMAAGLLRWRRGWIPPVVSSIGLPTAAACSNNGVDDDSGIGLPTAAACSNNGVDDDSGTEKEDAADRELWSGCEKLTQLSVVARLLNIKAEYRLPEQCFDAFCQLFKDGLPEDNNMVDNFYHTKKLIQGLGLPVEKIDCCRLGCMLYWSDDDQLTQCKFCQQPSRKVSRNDDGGDVEGDEEMLSIFKHLGRLYGRSKTRRLTDAEYMAAHTYILLNCEEVEPFIILHEDMLKELDSEISESELATQQQQNFGFWFENYARQNKIQNKYICDLSKWPLRTVKSYTVYFVNGYRFHTESHGENRSTMNSGICISSTCGDYYGKLIEILEIEYTALPIKRTVLFKCEWFDPTPNVRVKCLFESQNNLETPATIAGQDSLKAPVSIRCCMLRSGKEQRPTGGRCCMLMSERE
nr:transposon, En/Spm-like, Transposase-associated domain protein [Ipomoea batatas]